MEARAPLWYRLTDRVNALVWAIPAPRRLKVRLSLIVYRNPPTHADRVIDVLDALDAAGVEATVIGGWGVDALVGAQQRAHRDLDLLVDHGQVEASVAALAGLGYEEWYREDAPRFMGEVQLRGDVVVVRDSALRAVEIHPSAVPRADLALTPGTIAGRSVSCFSAEHQLQTHTGYTNQSRREGRTQRANLEAVKLAQRSRETDPPD